MRILLADDHHLVREAIASYLTRAARDISCIEAADLQQVRERLETGSHYDLIILDYKMPGMNGLSGLDEIRRRAPEAQVLILSGNMEPVEAERALGRGAAGVIMKDLRGTALLNALRLVAAGEVYVPSSLIAAVAGRGDQGRDHGRDHGRLGQKRASFANLTGRELDCVELLVRGMPNREIAAELDISEATVKLHLAAAFRKVGARNRSDAVRIAMLHGIAAE